LILAFKRAEKSGIDKVSTYQLLSMRQVLTIPGSIDEYISLKAKREKESDQNIQIRANILDVIKYYFLNFMTLLPILLPVFTWYKVYFYDKKSSPHIGFSINKELTTWTLNISGWCGFAMTLLCLICIYEWINIMLIWNQQRKEIRIQLLQNIAIAEEGSNA